MTATHEGPGVITDLDTVRKRRIRAGTSLSVLASSVVGGALIGYGAADNYEATKNRDEAEQSAAASRCLAFVLENTVSLDEPVIIRASDLTKQTREDCGAPAPIEKETTVVDFHDGKIIEDDYLLAMPSVEALEAFAEDKQADSMTKSSFNRISSAALGGVAGFMVPIFGLTGAAAVKRNRRRNGGRFSAVDSVRRSGESFMDAMKKLN